MKKKFIAASFGVLWSMALVVTGWAQENIPVGTWRLHLSFNEVTNLAVGPTRIYASSSTGIMILDKASGEITTLSKMDGLSSATIGAIAYDTPRDMLIIGYDNGLIDIIQSNTIKTFSGLAKSPAISGSRSINHITLTGSLAYMSTDFGVVVFDLERKEVKETYRDLSETGESLPIARSVVHGDSLFLATAKGVMAGSLNGSSNLLDFRNWKRYSSGVLDNPIESIVVFNEAVHVAINTHGVYKLQAGIWTQENFLQAEQFKGLSSRGGNLVITTEDNVWLSNGTTLSEIGVGTVSHPSAAVQDDDDTIWIADGERGLISSKNGIINSVKPNGPSSNISHRLNYSKDQIVRIEGGYSAALFPLNNKAKADQFKNGQWNAVSTTLPNDITDFAHTSSATYFSSFGFGLEKITESGTTIFDDANSPLRKAISSNPLVQITAIERSADALWVANYGVTTPLHFLSGSTTWESFSFPQLQAQYPLELFVDQFDQVWMLIDPAKGGGIIVFNKATKGNAYLTNASGRGALPSLAVRSIANDREGQVWIGTDEGVVYFPNPTGVFNATDASRPIFENRFLLRDESITAIAVDGGNRKWMGTNNGVWLFNASGEELIYNFTEDNSPLPSNRILSITIDPLSGEVFFATDKGIASFRSTATQSSFQFENVKIFPNPVTREFAGQVAINGLYRDAIVKITDLGGRLVFETRANGGTAVWNARQLNGDRVSTGMYFVFATSEDGAERHVGKIAVIE